MFFDDRLDTVLEGSIPEDDAARVQYIQLVDLLSQQSKGISPEQIITGLERVHALRQAVPEAERVEVVNSLQGRLKNLSLVQYLAADSPSVASAAIAAARLSDETWVALIPNLSVRARGFLRTRQDLGSKAVAALASYSAGDMVLPSPVSNEEALLIDKEPLTDEQSGSSAKEIAGMDGISSENKDTAHASKKAVAEREIGKIVARIEALRKARGENVKESESFAADSKSKLKTAEVLDKVGFETDDSGKVVWANSGQGNAFCGTNIAYPARQGVSGPDGYAAAAFRQRMPIESGRLQICDIPALNGSWRMDAKPHFDKKTGRFRGFRGEIRRPCVHEQAGPEQAQQRGDSMRQLIHELRTPLNAIMGFSEIIEQQLFGPAAYEYRSLASEIKKDAQFMLSGFDDLDVALKLDRQALEIESGYCSVAWLTARINERLEQQDNAESLKMNFARDFEGFAVAPVMADRIILRLITTLCGFTQDGEGLSAKFTPSDDGHMSRMRIKLPAALAELSETELFSDDIDVTEVPISLLGIGFSLRLVRRLAEQVEGKLVLKNGRIFVTLPSLQHNQAKADNAVLK
ncbi:histidine kinase dimerization/phospho-acceptor domain-containing protein [Sphingorhabdus sp. Alg239-R122]|uniref:histidine kinase dimerization/phospho-acceptor domain-containing protein n=1 Tax=Sphingorhabdus sp. Alg239-R122 TaxID=2305989 RepID=UPI0013DAB4EA|nr:histidine kinase dimerization/phospho-acceptor domain-containing protein [Sphingorhabdus sp. Alg239-R122]